MVDTLGDVAEAVAPEAELFPAEAAEFPPFPDEAAADAVFVDDIATETAENSRCPLLALFFPLFSNPEFTDVVRDHVHRTTRESGETEIVRRATRLSKEASASLTASANTSLAARIQCQFRYGLHLQLEFSPHSDCEIAHFPRTWPPISRWS